MEGCEQSDDPPQDNGLRHSDEFLRWIHALHIMHSDGWQSEKFPLLDYDQFLWWWLGLPPDAQTLLAGTYVRKSGILKQGNTL